MISKRVIPLALMCLAAGLCRAQEASLAVTGDVPKPLALTAADLAAMPRASVTVHEKNGGMAVYKGVALREILARAGAPFGKQLRGKALASYVLASASDGYEVTFALAELDPEFKESPSVLAADHRGGKPLDANQGPLRLVAAGDKIPARSVRMLEKLQAVMLRK